MYRLTVHLNKVDQVERKIKVGKDEKTKRYIYNTLTIHNLASIDAVQRRLADIRERYGIRQKNGKELYNIVIQ